MSTLAGNIINTARSGSAHPPIHGTGLLGVSNAVSDELIHDDELSDASNYIIDHLAGGVLVKREGLTKEVQTSLTEAGTSIHDGVNGDYFTTSTKIFTINGNERLSGLTSTTAPDWTSYNGKDIYADGTNTLRVSSNGTSFAVLGGTPPTFQYIEAYANMVFGAGHSTGILRWSAYGDEASWPAVNSLTITNNADDDIMGLAKFQNSLVVLCAKSFHHITASNETDISITYSNWEEGCTSHRSIVVSPYGLFWWSKNGPVWSPDGVRVIYIGKQKIPKTIDGLNRAQYSLVHALWNPIQDRIEFSVFRSGSTTVNRRLYYYPNVYQGNGQYGTAWFIGDGTGVNMGAGGVIITSGEPEVFYISASTNGFIYEQVGNDDAGTAITATLETKRYAPAGPTGLVYGKRLVPMFFLVSDATVTYGVYLDNSLSVNKSWVLTLDSDTGFVLNTDTLNVGTLGGGEEPKEVQIVLGRKYHKIKHRLTDTTVVRTRFRGIAALGYVIKT